jgi:hypothetical protein
MMKVTDCHRERVGGIVRFRNRRQRQQQANHFLYLTFLRVAVAGHSLLDRTRRVFANLECRTFSRQQSHAANLTKLQGNFWIRREERLFDRTGVGPQAGNYFIESAVDF